MLVNFNRVSPYIKRAVFLLIIVLFTNIITAQAQPPAGKDPSNPSGLPELPPTSLPANQLYDALKDKNGQKSSIGKELGGALKNKINKVFFYIL